MSELPIGREYESRRLLHLYGWLQVLEHYESRSET